VQSQSRGLAELIDSHRTPAGLARGFQRRKASRSRMQIGMRTRQRALLAVLLAAMLLAGCAIAGLADDATGDAPLARNDVFLIEWDGTQHELDVLANDSGTSNLTIVAVGPTTGSASIRPDENGERILFWPAGDFDGAETFTYTLVDEDNLTSTAKVKVTEQFDYTLSGTKTWALSYELGTSGLAQGFSFTQSLTVDLWAEALGVLAVSAQFDDQKELKDQHLSVELDTEYVAGALGDFSLSGAGDLFVANRTMTGVRIDVFPLGQSTDGPMLTAVASQLQGISRSITVRGETVSASIAFSASNPDAPWEDAGYIHHIDGLAAYTLDTPFVRGITVIDYAVPSAAELEAILDKYDLAVIAKSIEDRVLQEPPQDSTFASFADIQEDLVLKSDPRALLRTITREAIVDYNRSISEGESTISYPFVQGSDLEASFLEDVGQTIAFRVDEQLIPLLPRENRAGRFYNLGHGTIDPQSFALDAISTEGTVELTESDPDVGGEPNTYRLYEDTGIAELWMPASFFEDNEASIAATYSYARTGKLIVLDLGAVADSVRVTLNGQWLEEGVGYEVDYNDPATVLLTEDIGPEDVVRIEYEQFRGGLGSPAEFATAFFGAQASFSIGEAIHAQMSVLRSADIAGDVEEDPTVRTMPNAQTVFGFDASFDLDPLSGSLMLGYNDNVFPADDNLRPSLPNRITGIGADPYDRWILFTHYQGLTLLEDGEWETFDGSTGLASQRLYDLAVAADIDRLYLATAAGLTVVDTTGDRPFDRLDRWTNVNSDMGLPEGELYAVDVVEGTVWVAAAEALARARWDEADLSEAWEILPTPGIEPRVLATATEGRLLVGADNGAWWVQPADPDPVASMTPIASLQGISVRDISVFDDRVWFATDEGLAQIDPQGQFHWLVRDRSVHAVCERTGGVYYATEDGFYDLSLPEPVLGADRITAIACTDEALWVGQEAATDENYTLHLWSLPASPSAGSAFAFGNTITGIDGRDPLYFSGLDPADHTHQGWMMRLGFHRDYDIVDLDGSFTIQNPGFSAIGRIDRSDFAGWSLSMESADEAFDNIDYSLSHEYSVLGRSSDPASSAVPSQSDLLQGELENKIDIRFDLTDLIGSLTAAPAVDEPEQGPIVNATLTHAASTSSESAEDNGWHVAHTLRVSDSLFALDTPVGSRDLLSITLSTGGSIDEQLDRVAKLGASVAITPPGPLAADASWNRTLSTSGGSQAGSYRESFGVSADWRPDLPDLPFTAEASYGATGSRTSDETGFAVDHAGSAELRLDARPFAGWMITPRFEADASLEDGAVAFELEMSAPLQTASTSLRPSVVLEISGLGEQRTESEQRLSISYYNRTSERLQPGLSSTLRRTTVAYVGSKSTSWSLTLNPQLSWNPAPQVDAKLSGSITTTRANDRWTVSGTIRGDAGAPLTTLFPGLAAIAVPEDSVSEPAPTAEPNGSEVEEITPKLWRTWISASTVSADLSGNGSLRNGRLSLGMTARGSLSTPIGDAWSTGLSVQGDLSKLADLDAVDVGWLIEVHAAVQF